MGFGIMGCRVLGFGSLAGCGDLGWVEMGLGIAVKAESRCVVVEMEGLEL
jgi:hypothetical protein